MRDPYAVLDIPRNADEAQIKRAFRTLAKRHHPDQNSGDPKAKERFAEVNAAYEILGDPEKRKRFDRGEIGPDGKERFSGFAGGGFGGFKGFGTDPFQYRTGTSGGRAGGTAFEDILKDVFGRDPGGARGGFDTDMKTRPVDGEDVTARLAVTLEELVADTRPSVTLPTGKTLQVTIPDGVEDGQQIRLKGQGMPGRNTGRPGDAIVTVEIRQHSLFRRDGYDLRLDLPVSLDEAVLGAKIRVPTLEGAVGLSLAANTTGRKSLRIRGKGLPDKSGKRGDIIVIPRIVLPDEADRELEQAAHRLRRDRKASVRGPEFES